MVLSAPPWANLQCASQGSWNTLPTSHPPQHQPDDDLARIIYASAGSVNTTPTHDYVLIDTERDGISSPSGKRFGVEVRVVMQMVADGPPGDGESGLWNNRALPRVYLTPTEQQQRNINEINRGAFEACLLELATLSVETLKLRLQCVPSHLEKIPFPCTAAHAANDLCFKCPLFADFLEKARSIALVFVLEDFTLPACALPRLRDDVRFEYGLFHDLEEAEALQDVGNLGDSMQWPGRERDPFSIYLGVNAVHVPEERFYEFRESEWAAKDELLNLIEQMYLLGVAGHDGEKKRILAAMRARVLIDRLWRREIHPAQFIRTIISTLPFHPAQLCRISAFAMPHHHVETIAASPPLTGAPWISALLAPDTITYYFFRGGIDGYPPVYHSQHVRPPGITRLSREIHERLVPDLLEHLFRTQGHRNVEIIMPDKCDNATCECQVCGEFRGQRLNRSRLRMLWALLASSEASPPLPNDFTPEYETGFSLAFGIPSNLPSVPWATSYYCNLISKQNNRELLTEEETEAFVAWLEVQRPVMAATALEQIEMGGGALQVDADWIRNEEFLCPPRRITNWAVRKLVVEGVVPLIWAKTTGLVELDWDGRELGAWSEGNHELIRMRHQPAGVGEVIFGGHLAGEMWRDKARCCGLWPTMTAEDDLTPSSKVDAWDYYSDDDTTVAPSYLSSIEEDATIKGTEDPAKGFPFTSTAVSSVVLALTAAEIIAQLSRLFNTTIDTEIADMAKTPNMPSEDRDEALALSPELPDDPAAAATAEATTEPTKKKSKRKNKKKNQKRNKKAAAAAARAAAAEEMQNVVGIVMDSVKDPINIARSVARSHLRFPNKVPTTREEVMREETMVQWAAQLVDYLSKTEHLDPYSQPLKPDFTEHDLIMYVNNKVDRALQVMESIPKEQLDDAVRRANRKDSDFDPVDFFKHLLPHPDDLVSSGASSGRARRAAHAVPFPKELSANEMVAKVSNVMQAVRVIKRARAYVDYAEEAEKATLIDTPGFYVGPPPASSTPHVGSSSLARRSSLPMAESRPSPLPAARIKTPSQLCQISHELEERINFLREHTVELQEGARYHQEAITAIETEMQKVFELEKKKTGQSPSAAQIEEFEDLKKQMMGVQETEEKLALAKLEATGVQQAEPSAPGSTGSTAESSRLQMPVFGTAPPVAVDNDLFDNEPISAVKAGKRPIKAPTAALPAPPVVVEKVTSTASVQEKKAGKTPVKLQDESQSSSPDSIDNMIDSYLAMLVSIPQVEPPAQHSALESVSVTNTTPIAPISFSKAGRAPARTPLEPQTASKDTTSWSISPTPQNAQSKSPKGLSKQQRIRKFLTDEHVDQIFATFEQFCTKGEQQWSSNWASALGEEAPLPEDKTVAYEPIIHHETEQEWLERMQKEHKIPRIDKALENYASWGFSPVKAENKDPSPSTVSNTELYSGPLAPAATKITTVTHSSGTKYKSRKPAEFERALVGVPGLEDRMPNRAARLRVRRGQSAPSPIPRTIISYKPPTPANYFSVLNAARRARPNTNVKVTGKELVKKGLEMQLKWLSSRGVEVEDRLKNVFSMLDQVSPEGELVETPQAIVPQNQLSQEGVQDRESSVDGDEEEEEIPKLPEAEQKEDEEAAEEEGVDDDLPEWLRAEAGRLKRALVNQGLLEEGSRDPEWHLLLDNEFDPERSVDGLLAESRREEGRAGRKGKKGGRKGGKKKPAKRAGQEEEGAGVRDAGTQTDDGLAGPVPSAARTRRRMPGAFSSGESSDES